ATLEAWATRVSSRTPPRPSGLVRRGYILPRAARLLGTEADHGLQRRPGDGRDPRHPRGALPGLLGRRLEPCQVVAQDRRLLPADVGPARGRLRRRAAPEAGGRGRGDRLPRPQRGSGERVIVAFSVTPLGVGEDVGEYVADAVRVVRESGLPNRTDAMFTSVEGEWDEVMDVVRRAVAAVEARAPRVSLVLKADIRPGVSDGLTSKVETVERHLAAPGGAAPA